MRVLLDHDVPHGLRAQFADDYEVVTAQYQGWTDLDNGDLLRAADGEYAVLVTLDTNLIHQQDVQARDIGVVIIDVPLDPYQEEAGRRTRDFQIVVIPDANAETSFSSVVL